jgi:Ca2+-binding RTX toxin-like protein
VTSRSRAVLAAALALLAVPAAAPAATVSASNGKLTYSAASGEANHLTVSSQNGQIRFQDTGVSSMTAGAGCSPSSAQRVSCSPTAVTAVTIDLGDGSDSLSADVLLPFAVYGGLGNDQILTFAGDDAVDGGPGNDTIETGWGDDSIDGGDGGDSISGGYGDDTVVYATRTAGVSVSLDDVANDGAAGEADNVRPSVDGAVGGSGNDTLAGDAGGNRLTGNGGDDTLVGAEGDDTLDGGTGSDSLAGGAGGDTLRARDGAAETLSCGDDADVADADHDDGAGADCETVNRDVAPGAAPFPLPMLPPSPTGGYGSVIEAPVATIAAAPVAVTWNGVAALRVDCPSEAFEGCAGAIVLDTLDAGSSTRTLDVRSARAGGKRRLGGRRFKVSAGRGEIVPVRLDGRTWRKLRSRRRVRVAVTVTMDNAAGTTTSTQTVALRPRTSRR